MFDASVGAATHHVRDTGFGSGLDGHSAAVEAALRGFADSPPMGDHAGRAVAPDKDTSAHVPSDSASAQATVAVSAVLFVDPRVANWQTLANSVAPGTKVVVMDPSTDGLAQVSATMRGLRDVQTVNFLTYGTAGQIELGASTVDAAALLANAHEVAGWRDHMADNAQILLWGCDVGAGTGGAALVDDLHALTGAGVAASTGTVGDAAFGGGWSLTRTAGIVDPVVPFSATAVGAYQNVLDAPVPTVAFSNVPAQVLLGATFTETVSFTNTAAAAAGYGPIIELFAPNNSLDVATLTSATLLGASLPVTQLTLSTSVAGHLGTLGVLDPLIVDAAGAPVFVNAPAGTVAGDSMYVIQLPFGSFTVGQPTANVDLTFATTKTAMVPVVWTGSGKNKLRAGRRLKVAPFPESKSILDVAAVL